MDLPQILLKSPFLPPETWMNWEIMGASGKGMQARMRHVWLTVAMQEIQTTLALKRQAKLFHARMYEVC